jgi:hypothetical protein
MEELMMAHKKAATHLVGAVTTTIQDENSMTVGAIMPSAVLGSGSDSGDDDEVCTPIILRHFKWSCNLFGTVADFPITVNGMLDCGAHIVLIDPGLVEKLKIHRFKLNKPIPVTVAIQEDGIKVSHLYEYGKLSVSSPNNAWMSSTIKAVLAPNLCVPLLLGSPFLVSNHIVMDFKAGTAIDKCCGYNLLNPPALKCNYYMDPKKELKQAKKEI